MSQIAIVNLKVSCKRPVKRRRFTAKDFLDLDAADAEASDEDADEGEDDFIVRRADLDDDDVTASVRPSPFLVEEMGGVDPEELARRLQDRYRRMSLQVSRDDGLEDDLIKWIHTAEACPPHSVIPIWRIQVTPGREAAVVGTIMKMEESARRYNDIQSVTATPSSRGSVYMECRALATVQRIIHGVAFVRRGVPPVPIPLEDYRRLFEITDKPAVPVGSWVRYTRRGNYCGDLAWIRAYDPDTMGYTIWLVPRELRWGVCMPRPNHLKRPRPPARIPRELLLPCSVGSTLAPTSLLEFDDRLFQCGFLIRTEVPAYDLSDDRVGPSVEELDMWEASPLYQVESICDTEPSALYSVFSRSLRAQRDALYMNCVLERGDRVRIVEGPWRDCTGQLLEIDTVTRAVVVRVVDFSGPSVEVEALSSIVMVDFKVGDFVEVCWGLYAGMHGWVTLVDWVARSVDISEHRTRTMLGRDEVSPIEVCEELVVREWTVDMTCIRPKTSSPNFKPFSESPPAYPDKPEDSNDSKGKSKDAEAKVLELPCARPDMYQHLEVQVVRGKTGRGLYGTVKNTMADNEEVCILTEGCAINNLLQVRVEHVVERYTGLSLPELLRASPAERDMAHQKLEASQQRFWVAGEASYRSADAVPIAKLPSVHSVWPEVALSQAELDAILLAPPPSPPRPLSPPPLPANSVEHWLLHPALRDKYIDVVVSPGSGWGGRYDNCVGVIERLPAIKRGKLGSVQIRFGGTTIYTKRFIKLTNVFPLRTNEYEGHVSKTDARSVLEILGVYVVIIGPDEEGSFTYMGQVGYTTHGGGVRLVHDPNAYHVFPESSVCRSDPYPKNVVMEFLYGGVESGNRWARLHPPPRETVTKTKT
ncbi:hypothetical protein B0H11DRAFT_2257493 [Mycena galericulata]|nr:hypothetical protein B0H11DRAFT_2257493 [Mycena galericulata]